MSLSKKLVLAAVLVTAAASAFAQANTAEVDQRAINEQNRIQQGEQSGALNQREATRLQARQDRIDNRITTDEAKHGGQLTKREARKLNRAENRQSKHIYRQKHDAQTAVPAQ